MNNDVKSPAVKQGISLRTNIKSKVGYSRRPGDESENLGCIAAVFTAKVTVKLTGVITSKPLPYVVSVRKF